MVELLVWFEICFVGYDREVCFVLLFWMYRDLGIFEGLNMYSLFLWLVNGDSCLLLFCKRNIIG